MNMTWLPHPILNSFTQFNVEFKNKKYIELLKMYQWLNMYLADVECIVNVGIQKIINTIEPNWKL